MDWLFHPPPDTEVSRADADGVRSTRCVVDGRDDARTLAFSYGRYEISS